MVPPDAVAKHLLWKFCYRVAAAAERARRDQEVTAPQASYVVTGPGSAGGGGPGLLSTRYTTAPTLAPSPKGPGWLLCRDENWPDMRLRRHA
jgi:hypothetical protein